MNQSLKKILNFVLNLIKIINEFIKFLTNLNSKQSKNKVQIILKITVYSAS